MTVVVAVAVAADKRAADSANAGRDDDAVVVPVAVTQRAADVRRQQQRQPLRPVTTSAMQLQPNASADSIMQRPRNYNVGRRQRCVVAVLRRRQLQLRQRPVCGGGVGGVDVY